jgi:hypothetical protein
MQPPSIDTERPEPMGHQEAPTQREATHVSMISVPTNARLRRSVTDLPRFMDGSIPGRAKHPGRSITANLATPILWVRLILRYCSACT